jgi:hypothetical protein
VMERSFKRHQHGMETAIREAGSDLRMQMQAVADWLLSQPPVNIARMTHSDFTAISAENARKLANMSFNALREPLETALVQAQQAALTNLPDAGLAAISFVSLVETIHTLDEPAVSYAKQQIVSSIIEMLLNGWLRR